MKINRQRVWVLTDALLKELQFDRTKKAKVDNIICEFLGIADNEVYVLPTTNDKVWELYKKEVFSSFDNETIDNLIELDLLDSDEIKVSFEEYAIKNSKIPLDFIEDFIDEDFSNGETFVQNLRKLKMFFRNHCTKELDDLLNKNNDFLVSYLNRKGILDLEHLSKDDLVYLFTKLDL